MPLPLAFHGQGGAHVTALLLALRLAHTQSPSHLNGHNPHDISLLVPARTGRIQCLEEHRSGDSHQKWGMWTSEGRVQLP